MVPRCFNSFGYQVISNKSSPAFWLAVNRKEANKSGHDFNSFVVICQFWVVTEANTNHKYKGHQVACRSYDINQVFLYY